MTALEIYHQNELLDLREPLNKPKKLKNMNRFAKLFDLEEVDNQLLLTLEYDPDDEKDQVQVRTDFEGVSVKFSSTFSKKKDAIKFIKEYSRERALEAYKVLEELIS